MTTKLALCITCCLQAPKRGKTLQYYLEMLWQFDNRGEDINIHLQTTIIQKSLQCNTFSCYKNNLEHNEHNIFVTRKKKLIYTIKPIIKLLFLYVVSLIQG